MQRKRGTAFNRSESLVFADTMTASRIVKSPDRDVIGHGQTSVEIARRILTLILTSPFLGAIFCASTSWRRSGAG